MHPLTHTNTLMVTELPCKELACPSVSYISVSKNTLMNWDYSLPLYPLSPYTVSQKRFSDLFGLQMISTHIFPISIFTANPYALTYIFQSQNQLFISRPLQENEKMKNAGWIHLQPSSTYPKVFWGKYLPALCTLWYFFPPFFLADLLQVVQGWFDAAFDLQFSKCATERQISLKLKFWGQFFFSISLYFALSILPSMLMLLSIVLGK